jgi:hypothetical protein
LQQTRDPSRVTHDDLLVTVLEFDERATFALIPDASNVLGIDPKRPGSGFF